MAIEDIERGAAFEDAFSDYIDGKVQPQSGGGWTAKLDVKSSAFLVSCKSTKHKTFSIGAALFDELRRHLTGVGGEGDERMGVLALEIDGKVYIAQPCEDWLRLISSDDATLLAPTKAKQRKINAGTPAILRKMAQDES